jgi:hypothetical protein
MIEREENGHLVLARKALQILVGTKEPEGINVAALFKIIEFLDIDTQCIAVNVKLLIATVSQVNTTLLFNGFSCAGAGITELLLR